MKLLLWIGLVRRLDDGRIKWPIHFAPKHIWKDWKMLRAYIRLHGYFYVFRNLPGVIKYTPGRLLPRRWGFGFAGLIEIGDRG